MGGESTRYFFQGLMFWRMFLVVGLLMGFPLSGCEKKSSDVSKEPIQEEEAINHVLSWTCSMHPQIRQPKPGKCPLCGMDLIPVSPAGPTGQESLREVTLSETAIKLAEIEVAPVERKVVSAELRMVGKVDYDETRLAYICAWVPGRIDRLFVNFTGTRVEKGEPLVWVYSPELVSAQEEYLIALKSGSQRLIEASRKKLLLFGIKESQIGEIEKEGKAKTHLIIYAPVGGVVIHKNGFEGMYVETGAKIYTVADLSRVWVMLDAYESDLAWIRVGQEVEFETEAYPGERFRGKVVFIDPVLNEKTRTVKVRVEVNNPSGKLRPEMFVRAVAYPVVAEGGKVVADAGEAESSLVIPASAPLITGKRAVVYLQVPGKKGTFEGREVVLGPRVGNYYIVREGLSEGERVVVRGNFKIDSAVQILAKPSMMNPEEESSVRGQVPSDGKEWVLKGREGEKVETFEVGDTFKNQLDALYSAYFELHRYLSHDDFGGAERATQSLAAALKAVNMKLLAGEAHRFWMDERKTIEKNIRELEGAKDIESARATFMALSDVLYQVVKRFGTSGGNPVIRFHCPMAAGGRGAYWLQNKPGVENPYYGSAMFTCGEQVEVLGAVSQAGGSRGEENE